MLLITAPLPALPHLPLGLLGDVAASFNASFLALAGQAWLSWNVLLPYLLGLAITVIGLAMLRKETAAAEIVERLLALSPLFVAMPMAVFAGDHFVGAQAIARMVPSWIPGSLFWAYFVGVALICAALSLAANRYSGLAAAGLGIMWLGFEALMHIPTVVRIPHERLAWNIALRDISFAGGAFALAITTTEQWRKQGKHGLLWAARLSIALPVLIFGIESLVFPLLTPGVPDSRITPTWMPFRSAWGYATGALEVATGFCLTINRRTREAALWLGIGILLLVLFFYLPILIAYASSIDDGLNYFADTLVLSGVGLLYAKSQRPAGASQADGISVVAASCD